MATHQSKVLTDGLQMMKSALAALVALAAIAGCTSRGPTDDPVTRAFTWFSYVNGDDLRQRCTPSGPGSYRLVYNANYDAQVRTYDIQLDPGDRAGMVNTRVFGGPAGPELSAGDLLAPWRGKTSQVPIDRAGLAALDGALAAAGFDEPAPRGLRLRSDGFFWAIGRCRNGQYKFNAYASPSPRFDRLHVIDALMRYDRTGVAVNPPTGEYLPPYVGSTYSRELAADNRVNYRLEVGANGIVK
jgi:hypothetical protein